MGLFYNNRKAEIRTLQLQIDITVDELIDHYKKIEELSTIIKNQNKIIEQLKTVIEDHIQNHRAQPKVMMLSKK